MFRRVRLLVLRSIRTRPSRTLLSGFGIILGVACLLAIRLTNLTALDSIIALFEDTTGKADLVVISGDAGDEGLPVGLVERITSHPDVEIVVPSLQVQTSLAEQSFDADLNLQIFGSGLGGLTIFGIDPLLDLQIRNYNLRDGRFLSPDGSEFEIVLVDQFAADQAIQVGDRVAILTPNGEQNLEVVGFIAREGPGTLNNGAFGVIPLDVSQEFYNRPDEVDQLDIIASSNADTVGGLEALRLALEDRVGDEYRVAYPAAQGRRVSQMLDGYQIGLSFLSGMALFVGAYLIYNAFSMTVVERTREFGFLRTLGMTRRQVTGQVFLEAGVLGLVGAVSGLFLGLLMARGFTSLLAGFLNQPALPLSVPPVELVQAFMVGMAVTLFAAALPAWQAGRISPLEALRVRGTQRAGWILRLGWIPGLGLLLLSTYILIRNPFPYDVQFRLGSLTVIFLFLGATLVLPASVQLWERLARPAARRIFGSSGGLGSRNIQRAHLRTTLTAAALMIAVAMILITRGMTDSFRLDLQAWIDAYIGGDLYVSASVPMRPRVGRHLESVAGVAAVAPVRYFEVAWDRPGFASQNLSFMAIDPAAYLQVTSFVFSDSEVDTAAAVQRLSAGDAVFVSSVLAEKFGLSQGDTLRLRTRSGARDFEIAAVVVDFFNQGQVIQGNWIDMRRYFRLSDASLYLVKILPGAVVADVERQIETQFGNRDHLQVESNQALIDQALGLLAQSYSLFDALALIAVLVAGLGVVNTLTMNVMERTQEIGMLRSIGMTRPQVIRMILAEAGLLGLIGGVLGLAFGLILTRIFLWGMTAMSGYKVDYYMPWWVVGLGLAIALLVSQLAALMPARRAVQTDMLEAIYFE